MKLLIFVLALNFTYSIYSQESIKNVVIQNTEFESAIISGFKKSGKYELITDPNNSIKMIVNAGFQNKVCAMSLKYQSNISQGTLSFTKRAGKLKKCKKKVAKAIKKYIRKAPLYFPRFPNF